MAGVAECDAIVEVPAGPNVVGVELGGAAAVGAAVAVSLLDCSCPADVLSEITVGVTCLVGVARMGCAWLEVGAAWLGADAWHR